MGKNRNRSRYKGPVLTAQLTVGPGDRVELSLGPLNRAGETTAVLDGAPVEVAGGIQGERVIVEVGRVFPERVVARVVEVLEASPERVAPPCRHFPSPHDGGGQWCTGCQWQHVRYERQLEMKRDRVCAELAKWPALVGVEVLPTVPSPRQLGYRNHARFTVGRRQGEVGYVNAGTRRFMRIDRCLIMDDRINETLAALQDRLPGMTQASVRVGVNTDSMLIQPKLDNSVPLESGQKHYEEEINGRRFRIAAPSFFQVNTGQLPNVVALLKDRLRLTGSETVVDAYCGVGVFAVLLAPYAARVIGIEESPSAVADARRNAEGLSNVTFVEARSEEALVSFTEHVDAVVLDPPRKGCHPDVLDALCRLRPGRVALVSCEPEAMARDLARLSEGPFTIENVTPVDMFPQTRHVEAVASLRLT